MSRQELGQRGEECAAAFLERKGYRIAARNYRAKVGEIDIIAWQDRETLVFVEVKTRRTLRYGTPQEAVTASKQINLRHAAVQWLSDPEHRMPHNGVRFDVITIVVQGDHPLLHHIEGAF